MKTPDEIFKEKIDFLLKAEKSLNKKVIAHQRKLYELLVSEYLPQFKLTDGFIDTGNEGLIAKIDNFFNKLEKALYRDVISVFAKDLIKSTILSGQYFEGLGFKKTVVDSILRNKVAVEKKIGITPTGRAKKNSYLYNLGKTRQVRDELVSYVVKNLTGDVSFADFQLGFKNLVIGSPKGRKQGLSTKGSLQRYFDQYAYDKYNEVDSIANSQIAKELQLEHFIYEGSVIDTTRPFCNKRAGKAFSVKETKTWKDDPDLIDKKTKDAYRPLIDRGRYRCRHFIKYITKQLYLHLTGKKAA